MAIDASSSGHAHPDSGGNAQDQQAKADRLEAAVQRSIQQPGLQLGEGQTFGRDGVQKRAKTNDFPARLIPKDDYDKRFALKREQMTEATNMYGKNPIVTLPITEKDLEYIEDKRKVSNKIQYERWLHSCIDWTDPASGKLTVPRNNSLTHSVGSFSSLKNEKNHSSKKSGKMKKSNGVNKAIKKNAAGKRSYKRSNVKANSKTKAK